MTTKTKDNLKNQLLRNTEYYNFQKELDALYENSKNNQKKYQNQTEN